ncbi:MAG: hypothetical protein PUJ82_05660, partial [Spirochaetales bacterium]|nr:hypothetical protein [Spirochaetales bacterium]MDY5915894.1 hypothetical protein [Treponema sp.]
WLFASQKTGYPGFRYRSSRFPRFAQSSGHLWCPYYPCHERNSKLNLFITTLHFELEFVVYGNVPVTEVSKANEDL